MALKKSELYSSLWQSCDELRGGIPNRDIDALEHYWQVIPGVRTALFAPFPSPRARRQGQGEGCSGYSALRIPQSEIKSVIFGHAEFTAFKDTVTKLFAKWRRANTPHLTGMKEGGKPKALIDTLSENLLDTFDHAPLLDAYDVYQRLMDYWAETMQDDCYVVSAVGWKAGAQVREIVQVKNKDGKLVWPEEHDFKLGKRRFKSDLIPAPILIARYFVPEREAIKAAEDALEDIERQLGDQKEEQGVEGGLLEDVVEGEGEKRKITSKAVKARLKEIGKDPDFPDERKALEDYAALMDKQSDAKSRLKQAQEDLDEKLAAKYPKLTEDEIKTLVVEDKWLATLAAAGQGELDRVSQALSGRVRQLAERYATPLPQLTNDVETLAARVQGHLKKMGAVCK